MNTQRIKIYCRSFDLKLYRLSKGLYESWGFESVRLTDQTADGYFYTMLRDTSCDIAINVDEDCFLTDKEALLSLVQHVVDNGIAIAGCQDGGIRARCANPLVVNPFFNVINMNVIRSKFNINDIKNFDYERVKAEMIANAPKLQLDYKYNFNISIHTDPYYPFMLWLARNFRVLYLTNRTHADNVSTELYWSIDGQERLLCIHTWFARYYSVPAFVVRHWQPTAGRQQQRINAVIDEAYAIRNLLRPNFSMVDELAFVGNKIIRWSIKIPQRIAGWPRKLQRKIQKRRA